MDTSGHERLAQEDIPQQDSRWSVSLSEEIEIGILSAENLSENKLLEDSFVSAPKGPCESDGEGVTTAVPLRRVLTNNFTDSTGEEKIYFPHTWENNAVATASPKTTQVSSLQTLRQKRRQQIELPNVDKKRMDTRHLMKEERVPDTESAHNGFRGIPQQAPLLHKVEKRSFYESLPTSGSHTTRERNASFASIDKGTRNDATAPPHEVYTLRQFQQELSRAIKLHDTLRFKEVLKMFKECVAEKNIMINDAMELGVELITTKENGSSLVGGSGHQKSDENANENRESSSIVDHVVDHTRGYTLTHLAVASGNVEIVEACLEFGSAVHAYAAFNGHTPLTLALNVLPEVVSMMMIRGKDMNLSRVNMYGRSVLHSAVVIERGSAPWSGRFACIKFLVEECKVKASLKDLFGHTAAMLAGDCAENYSSAEEYEQIRTFLEFAEAEENVQRGAPKETVRSVDEQWSSGSKKKEEKPIKSRTVAEGDEERELAQVRGAPRLSATTEKWDRVRFLISGPLTRQLCILLLIFLHIMAYATNVSDRTSDSSYLDARCEFWFTIINNIGSCWGGTPFFLRIVHVIFSFGFAAIGAVLFRHGVRLIGRFVLRVPICGAQSRCEKKIFESAFRVFYRMPYNVKDRGSFFFTTIGVLIGVYSGAKFYNLILRRFWPGQLPWALILPTISGLDTATALRNFLVVTLMLDWYIFAFVFDVMYQQGYLNVYLPHYRFASFATCLNNIFRWMKRDKKLSPQNMYYIRLLMHWIILLFGWIIIAACFVTLEFCVAPAHVLFAKILIRTHWPGMPIVLASWCIFVECVIICQEWTWPTFQEHPLLLFPGCTVVTHNAWFLVFVVWALSSLDMRTVKEHIVLLQNQPNGMSTGDIVSLCFSLLPAGGGALLLLSKILLSSLWFEGLSSALYSAHMYALPCRLPTEADAQLAKEIRKEELVRLHSYGNLDALVEDRRASGRGGKGPRRMERESVNAAVRRRGRPEKREDCAPGANGPPARNTAREEALWESTYWQPRVGNRHDSSCSSRSSSCTTVAANAIEEQEAEEAIVNNGKTKEVERKFDNKP